MKSRVAYCLLIGVSAWGQTTSSRPEAPEKGKIVGEVTNAVTGEPVRKASIYVESGKEIVNAISDSEGRYEVPELNPGLYQISVERDGYLRQTFGSTVTLVAGAAVEAKFRLVKQSAVTGRVINEDGEPAMRVTVELKKITYKNGKAVETPAGFGSTDDKGNYRVFDIPAGKYTVVAAKEEEQRQINRRVSPPADIYVPVYYPGTIDLQRATRVVVPKSGEVNGIDITLQKVRSYTISGTVINSVHGRSNADQIVVTLAPGDELSSSFEPNRQDMLLRPDGTFEFLRIAPGPYEVKARFLVDDKTLGFQELTVVDNVTGVALTLQPCVTVAGTVKMEGDALTPVSHLSISLLRENGESMPHGAGDDSSVETEDNGSFEIGNAAPLKVRLSFGQLPEGTYVKRVTAGSVEFTDKSLDLSILHGAPVTVLLSPKAAAVNGTVTNDKGQVATNVTVVLVPDTPDRSRHELYKTATLDQYGHYKLGGIAPGSYRLFAFQNLDEGAWEDPDYLKTIEKQGVPVSLAESDRQSSDLTVIAGTEE